jgi:hypothetical protein
LAGKRARFGFGVLPDAPGAKRSRLGHESGARAGGR